jgi:fructose-bisphosphate aldolase, class II
MAQGAVEYAKELGCNIPIALHLDHGNSLELCKNCIQYGFSSVDGYFFFFLNYFFFYLKNFFLGSHLKYDKNIELTKKVVEFAHNQKDYVTVEGYF